MNVEFLATEGFTKDQVAQVRGEREELAEKLRKSPEIARFIRGVFTLRFSEDLRAE